MTSSNGWTSAHLEDLTDPTRSIRYGIVQPGRFDPDGRYMIRGQDYSESRGWAKPIDLFRVSARVESKYKKARVRAGDLIITIVGAGTGHVEVVPDWLDGANLTQTTARIAIRSDMSNPQFCMYLLQSDLGREQVATYVKGNAQPGLNVADVKRFTLVMPPREIQDAVAKRLQDVDALISSLRALIDKKRAIKQGMFQELLAGKTRLPGFVKPWRAVRLGDHVSYVKNAGLSRAQLDETSPLRYLHYGDIHTRGASVLDASTEKMPRVPRSLVGAAGLLQVGDLIFADASEDAAGVGKSVEITGVPLEGAIPGLHTIAARFDTRVLANGFKAFLQFMTAFREQLLALAAGTKVLATTRAYISRIELTLPSVAEQSAIAEVLRDADLEIEALERRLESTRAIKEGMMQVLLTGRTRLVSTEASA
jgi:type I restriction enzyme S subunit